MEGVTLGKQVEASKISLILPCFNEAEGIEETLSRVGGVVTSWFPEWEIELIIVDDGSFDSTVELALATNLPSNVELLVLRFTRNFGHQAAISAGIERSSGSVVAIMDADLQDPPELLPVMVAKLGEGFHIVSGKRTSRDGVGWVKKSSYSIFYRLLGRVVTEIDIPMDTGDFRVMSRRAADELLALPERNRFVRGLLPYTGLAHCSVEYDRSARSAGESKYNLKKLIKLAFDGLFSFSTEPLRVALYLGGVLFGISIMGVLAVLIIRLGTDEWVPGWAGQMVILLSFGGLQFLFLGLLGEYIGRIFDEVKRRPSYIILEELRK